MHERTEDTVWWKNGIVYHIYPQSFYDTNGDGTGDLRGIILKLDYLAELGIDAIWLSPVYESPLIDGGYDISDYFNIHPVYGSLKEFRELLEEAHKREIRIIMDMVLNHTSDKHPWFREACSSPENPYRNWYIWHPGRKGKKPNNWRTNFGRCAWTFHPGTQVWYYHSFFPEQPDLNWRNPEVKKTLFKIIRYWLELGVDGIRLDVINLLFKNTSFENNPWSQWFSDKKLKNRNQPEVFDLLKELRSMLDKYEEKVSIGEIYVSPPGNPALATSFLGNGNDMLHMTFDFSLLFTFPDASHYYQSIKRYYDSLPAGGWPCFVLSNHDLGRNLHPGIFFRKGNRKAKILAALLLTLRGTPFIYYGDEIGMQNASLSRKDLRDRYGKMFYPFYKGRDKARTPMQWDNSLHAGFTTSTPWLPVHPDYPDTNVETASQQNDSLYQLYKTLIRLRRKHPVLRTGKIRLHDPGRSGVLEYTRYNDKEEIRIFLNFSGRKRRSPFPPGLTACGIIFSNYSRTCIECKNGKAWFSPFEILIIKKRSV